MTCKENCSNLYTDRPTPTTHACLNLPGTCSYLWSVIKKKQWEITQHYMHITPIFTSIPERQLTKAEHDKPARLYSKTDGDNPIYSCGHSFLERAVLTLVHACYSKTGRTTVIGTRAMTRSFSQWKSLKRKKKTRLETIRYQ